MLIIQMNRDFRAQGSDFIEAERLWITKLDFRQIQLLNFLCFPLPSDQ